MNNIPDDLFDQLDELVLDELNLFLSDLSAEGRKKYFEFFGCTKEEMYGKKPESRCYIASCFKVPNMPITSDAEAIEEFDNEEALKYTD